MASIEIDDVWKAYGDLPVIHGIDLVIPEGAFAILVGPSGCGKSTLLRMIAGLEDITAGEVRIGDKIVNDIPPKDRDIAMVFQNYALYPHMTIGENMGFSLKLRKQSKKVIREAVEKAADILGLRDLLNRYPRQLSGGQRQRVAMGRAIVRDPSVFLFDEPLSNLDAKLRVQMRAEIKSLHQRLKTTTVYVTHDQIEAMTMADIIVVMKDGVIMQQGTPLDLYDNPENRFVAGFIGSPAMNFMEGKVVNGHLEMSSGLTFPLPEYAAAYAGQKLICGVRPEHFVIDERGVPGTVTLVEPTGSEFQISLEFGDQAAVVLLRERLNLKPGDTLQLMPDMHSIFLFEAENGDRIREDRSAQKQDSRAQRPA